MKVEDIARICHEANRAYCSTIGDDSQLAWNDAPQWARDSAIKGVQFAHDNPTSTPEKSHESWLKEKQETGWKYGPVKDVDLKEHPCFVPYSDLPHEQQVKDHLFQAVARTFFIG
jgi:hypothetical protein